MIRWSHGHSLATGGLLGLALVRADLFLVLAGVFVAGLVLGRFWARLVELVRRFADRRRFVIHSDGSPYPGPGRFPFDVPLRRRP